MRRIGKAGSKERRSPKYIICIRIHKRPAELHWGGNVAESSPGCPSYQWGGAGLDALADNIYGSEIWRLIEGKTVVVQHI
ncbi:hypothetical protein H5410_053868 [Solanum commersonii]|uniref:Uncharacterized protein n=1 Tax=Solanum commersonii TaxID=4109 RepID=A0A9J5X4M5_SOLCO|nr:hypothetical protein H5410_053868 [Solanum commersonii]